MGQYHYIVNLDKREYIHPHEFNDGFKLMEFGASGRGTMLGLAVLLAASNKGGARGGGDLHPWRGGAGYEGREAPANPTYSDEFLMKEVVGRWAGDRIAIIGDYYVQDDVPGFTDQKDTPWDDEKKLDEEEPGEEESDDAGSVIAPLSWTNISAMTIAAIELDFYVWQERHPKDKGDEGPPF